LPKTKKKKPGNGRAKTFETIFLVSDLVLILFLWVLNKFFDVSAGEIIAFYLIGTLVVLMVLRAIDRKAASKGIELPSRL
jgi:F0F1-type ATP synthase assembly protein I